MPAGTRPLPGPNSQPESELALLRREVAESRQIVARYRAVFDRSFLVIYVHDMDGWFVDANGAALRLLGYEPDDVPTLNMARILAEEELPKALEAFEGLKRKGYQERPVEYRLRRKDGRFVWVEAETCLFSTEEDGTHVLGIARDVTARHQAQEALRRSEEKYRHLVENANDVVLVLQDDEVKFANQRASNLTGYSVAEFLARPFIEHVHPEDREMVYGRHRQRLKGEAIAPYTFRVQRKDGETVWVEISAVFIPWEGKPGVLCLIRDINEVKNLEDQLQQARRMESLGRLAGGIAHDFNNMMTVVNGYSDMLLARFPESDPNWQDVFEIRQAGKNAAELTRQILAFGRRQILRPPRHEPEQCGPPHGTVDAAGDR